MKQTIRFQTVIEMPTARELALRRALQALPESNVESFPGWPRFESACHRLAAAEQAVKEAEQAIRDAAKQLGNYVAMEWTLDEIPPDLRHLLNTWR